MHAHCLLLPLPCPHVQQEPAPKPATSPSRIIQDRYVVEHLVRGGSLRLFEYAPSSSVAEPLPALGPCSGENPWSKTTATRSQGPTRVIAKPDGSILCEPAESTMCVREFKQ